MEDSTITPKSDPEAEKPQVFDLAREGRSFKFTRRDFIKVAGALSVSAASAACTGTQAQQEEATDVPPTDTPSPTDTSTPTATSTPTKTPRPTRTPAPTRTYTPTPVVVRAATKKQGINLRAGPGTYYYAIGSLASNIEVTVIARLADSSWFNVLVDLEYLPILKNAPIAKDRSDVEGWIRADLLNILEGNIEDLPTKEAPPTPTPLPNQKPTGEEGITYEYTDLYGNVYHFTLPCGSPIPAGAICTCNCVTLCSCDSYVAPPSCSCDSHSGSSVCLCNLVTYWYPN